MNPRLTNWSAYVDAISPKRPDKNLAIFHTRFKFAANFESINVKDTSPGTLLVYGAITKVAFSYSALEQLEHALGIKEKPSILAPDLARRVKEAMPYGMSRVTDRMRLSPLLEARLIEFFQNENSKDVRPVIEQFRHALFHGRFTPAGWGLKGTRGHEELLMGLAQVTLRKADETFTRWFKAQRF